MSYVSLLDLDKAQMVTNTPATYSKFELIHFLS